MFATIHQYGNRILCLAFFSMMFGVIPTQALCQSRDVKLIQDMMRAELEFWNKGDIEGYVSLYAPVDSVRMLYTTGAVYGRDNLLAFYKKYWPKDKMGQLSFSDIKIERLSRKYYFTSGYFHVLQSNGDKVNGRFSGLVIKIKGKWYLYTDHSG